MCCIAGGENPERNDNGKKANNMDDQDQTFDHGQLFGQEGIEENGKSGDGNDQHGPVPALKDISRIIQDDETLDNRPRKKSDRDDGTLPSRRTEPTCILRSAWTLESVICFGRIYR